MTTACSATTGEVVIQRLETLVKDVSRATASNNLSKLSTKEKNAWINEKQTDLNSIQAAFETHPELSPQAAVYGDSLVKNARSILTRASSPPR